MEMEVDTSNTMLKLIFITSVNYIFLYTGTNGQVLTPPYFNLAVGRPVEATSTCGVGVSEPELFCKLTGANPDKEDVIGDFEVIQGQLCDYCDPRESSRTHSPESAVDGTERWWQSPPLSRGMRFNEVNFTINLGQVGLFFLGGGGRVLGQEFQRGAGE